MSVSPRPTLLSIVAHARAGALDHAWRLFREAGFEGVRDDAGALSVRGRLLKDRALATDGADRRAFYAEAALAYAEAGALTGASYPLINAATLALLGGEPAVARTRAVQVLEVLDRDADEAETPYWRQATRAEALLLLGRTAEAKTALAEAVSLAPEAWEDQAATLRQFALILAALEADAGWLDLLRPPRSLHYAGLMRLEAAGVAEAVGLQLAAERIGAGYGALAAGADILVAEALVARGAQLHLILPGGVAAFASASVDPAGGDWRPRFDALMAAAESVRVVAPGADPTQALAVQLAAEVAMGCAVMRARALATEAVQIVVVDEEAEGSLASRQSLATWTAAGRRRQVIAARRFGGEAPVWPAAETLRLAALLSVDLGDTEEAALIGEVLPALAAAAHPLAPPRWEGRRLAMVFAGPAQAAAAALAIRAAAPQARSAGHYGLLRAAPDPFGGAELLLGETADLPAQILAATPVGAIQVSDDFAAALHALRPSRTEYVGDLDGGEIRLHALKA